MAEVTSKFNIAINTTDLRQAAEATGEVAKQAGQGRREAEAMLALLQKQKVAHTEIGQALEAANKRLKDIQDLQAKFHQKPEDVFGPLVSAGQAPAGGYPALERQLGHAEREARATLDRLQRQAERVPTPGQPGAPGTSGHQLNFGMRFREMLELAGIASGVGRFRQAASEQRQVYGSLFRAGMASSTDPGNQEAMFTEWNESGKRNVFLERMARIGVGPQQLAQMEERYAGMTGRMQKGAGAAPEFLGRLAGAGAMAGNPQLGLEYYQRTYKAADMTEGMATAMLGALLRFSDSGIPRRELFDQNANLVERMEKQTLGSTHEPGAMTGILRFQQALTNLPEHLRARGLEVADRLFSPKDSVLTSLVQAETYAATSRAAGGGGGRSPLGSYEDRLRAYQLFQGGGIYREESGEARVNFIRSLQRGTQMGGGGTEGEAFAAWHMGYQGISPETFHNLVQGDPESWRGKLTPEREAMLKEAEAAHGGTGAGKAAGEDLDNQIKAMLDKIGHGLGADSVAAENIKRLGNASMETAIQLEIWADRLMGYNPATTTAAGPVGAAISWGKKNLLPAGGIAAAAGAAWQAGKAAVSAVLGRLTAAATVAEVTEAAAVAAEAGVASSALVPALIAIGIPAAIIAAAIGAAYLMEGTAGDKDEPATGGGPKGTTGPAPGGVGPGVAPMRGQPGARPLPSFQPGVAAPMRGDPSGSRTHAEAPATPMRGIRPAPVTAEEFARREKYRAQIDAEAKALDIDPMLAHGVVGAESQFRQSAVSPKGATGLFQLMPGTARGHHVDPNDASQNIHGGLLHLRQVLDTAAKRGHHGDDQVKTALQYYNMGEYHKGPIPQETQNYTGRVFARQEAYRQHDLQEGPRPPKMAPVPSAISQDDLAHFARILTDAQATAGMQEPREVQSERGAAVALEFHGDTGDALRALPYPSPAPPLSGHGYSRGR